MVKTHNSTLVAGISIKRSPRVVSSRVLMRFSFPLLLLSSGRECTVLSGCAAGADVTPACTPGRNPEEEDGTVVGCSGSPHLAAVSQDGWAWILW